MSVLCPAVGDIVAVCVVLFVARSVFVLYCRPSACTPTLLAMTAASYYLTTPKNDKPFATKLMLCNITSQGSGVMSLNIKQKPCQLCLQLKIT